MTSFDFAWSKDTKATGTAFARRKASPKVSKQKQIPTQTTSETPTKIVVESGRSHKFEKSRVKQSNAGDSGVHVKRKQRKDKLAAKAGQEDDLNANKVVDNKATHSLFSVRKKDVYVKTNVKGKSVVEKVFDGEKKFGDLEIHRHVVANLEKNGFTSLTKVQEKAIPEVLAGKNVLIRSQTGSGKTLAYAVPIIDSLQSVVPRLRRQDGVQVIVVVPTRELALQTHELFGKINTFQWLVVGHLCGGENRKTEKVRLRKGVHVLIGTPGRLLDHILHTQSLRTDSVRCLVLDEADRLLDMGFKKDIVKIVEEVDRAKTHSEYDPLALLRRDQSQEAETQEAEEPEPPLRNPSSKNRQTILLSATLTKAIAELADFTMKDHTYVDSLDDPTVNPAHMVIPETVKQEFVVTYAKHRLFTLSAVLAAKAKQKVFVFMATTQMVDYHYELFTKWLLRMPKNRGKLMFGDVTILDDVELEGGEEEEEEVVLETRFFKLHGSMDQGERREVFKGFREAKRGILLCTDVAARGVDVPEADCIIQYTGPQTDEDYLHRVGRTGRAGKSGWALIFLTHEEQEYVTKLQDHKVFWHWVPEMYYNR